MVGNTLPWKVSFMFLCRLVMAGAGEGGNKYTQNWFSIVKGFQGMVAEESF